MAFPSPSIAALPYWVAKDAGLFTKYGVDVELVRIQGSSLATAAMLAGEVQAVGEGPAAVLANLEGADLVYVASPLNRFAFAVISQPQIRRPEDLRGERLGVTRFGSGTDFALRYALGKWGLVPDRDVVLLQTGGVPETLAAIRDGGLAAGVTSDPHTARARVLGLNILADLAELEVDYPQISLVVRRPYLAEQPEVIDRMVRAISEAIYIIKTDPAITIRVLREQTNIEDQAVLEDVQARWRGYFQAKPYPRVEAMQTVLEELASRRPDARTLNPTTLVDQRFVRALDETGFFDALYGSTRP
ncbi:MAG TPA: ABC transporter substrate-binding protein [Chloroflexota bacterium]|jgi:NitT/TauT family transport system substrate-binding protein|nr:ABC transporter substrate-binding protein [Chloroflexota bacterium]